MTERRTDDAEPRSETRGGAQGEAGDARPLDAMSRSSIETRLRSMYDEVASEPVPDRFVDLLDRLERSEGEGGPR